MVRSPRLIAANSLIDALPDLVVLVRRDGVILDYLGGTGLAALLPQTDVTGEHLESVWPEPVATAVKQLVRRAIAQRTTVEAPIKHADMVYELRANAQGPDRAICIIRASLVEPAADDALESEEFPRPQLDRRGFLRRFQATLAQAAIQEKPAAVAVLHIEGIADIARAVDAKVAEEVLRAAILRVPLQSSHSPADNSGWYFGQLNENTLALVIETSDRDAIENCVSQVCGSLREPVDIGDDGFHLTPYAGVAILGQDALSPKALLDHARSAAAEARRRGSAQVSFFTDTLKLRSLARLDMAREMRAAIDNRDIRLRYVTRHDLATGRLVAHVGYLRWRHPLRGEVRPSEFLSLAETTGLAAALSRAAMHALRDDFAALKSQLDPDAMMSFGPLRHHMLQENFVGDIDRFLADAAIPAARLELRISEQTFAALSPSVYRPLRELGVQIIVDEMGRGFGSLNRLARAPIWGLQLDRAWVTALQRDEVAVKVCRAGISAATALGLTPIATGVDDETQRQILLSLGCGQGSGDLYLGAGPQFDTSIMRQTSRSGARPGRPARP
jgi:EAL domain-containing protein (putative c-di-GMP-specific phosphodiesterase class I)/GGDEF domain-containing protein